MKTDTIKAVFLVHRQKILLINLYKSPSANLNKCYIYSHFILGTSIVIVGNSIHRDYHTFYRLSKQCLRLFY